MRIEYPAKVVPVLYTPGFTFRYLYGGRGGAKSWSFARRATERAANERIRILCCREIQNSIKESVFYLIKEQIGLLGMGNRFSIGSDSLRSAAGAEFIFMGLSRNLTAIKSLEAIDIAYVEEAQKVSRESWQVLIPTIRKQNSEIWASFNPEDETDDTYNRFVLNPPPDSIGAEVNFYDNPWFPEILWKQMEYDRKCDWETYEHIWLGKTRKYSARRVIKRVRVEEFDTPGDAQFFFGADFGFSNDPTVLVRFFIRERKLYIDWEAHSVGIELEDLHEFFATVPESDKWEIIADSARPDTISFLSRPHTSKKGIYYEGYNIRGATKGAGSVEDGIQFINGFEEVIIHPRCQGTKNNFENYHWKVDKISGKVLPIPVDACNDAVDATRYGLEPYSKSSFTIYDALGVT